MTEEALEAKAEVTTDEQVEESIRDTLEKEYYKEDDGTTDIARPEGKVDTVEEPVEEEVKETEAGTDALETNDEVENESGDIEASEEEVDFVTEAPGAWTKEEKEYFNNLPDNKIIVAEDGTEYDIGEIKRMTAEYYKNMQSGMDKKFQEYADGAKVLESYSDIFNSYGDWIRQQGMTEPQLLGQLVQTHQALITNPAETIKGLMANLGVSPEQVGAASVDFEDDWDDLEPEGKNRHIDKKYDEAIAEINRLKQQMMQSQQGNAQGQVDSFVNAVDSEGKKLHPEFDEVVEQEMAVLINTARARGEVLTLEEAYAKSPTVIQRSFEKTQESKRKAEAKARREKVAEAKKSSKTISTKVAQDNRPQDIDLRQHLKKVMDGTQ